MALTQIQKLKLNQQVDMVLQSPANQVKDGKLEIAFVIDMSSNVEYLRETAARVAGALKQHDRIFQNVRCNVVYWGADRLTTKVTPMPYVQMGRIFEDVDMDGLTTKTDGPLKLDNLLAYLKLFHARSKCILVISEGNYEVSDKGVVKEALNPFLKSRLVFITPQELRTGLQLFLGLL